MVIHEPTFETPGARAKARCDFFGKEPFSDTADGLFRAYLTPAHAAALNQLIDWMKQMGVEPRLDAMANLIGRYEGQSKDAPVLVIGSHIDSVRDAGNYDGALGVMIGLEVIRYFYERDERLPFSIEIIAFGDEEGSRFPGTMMTTRALVGKLTPEVLDIADYRGIHFQEARTVFKDYVKLDLPEFGDLAHLKLQNVFAYLEAHIEQGPLLESENRSLGVVSSIAAQLRYKMSLHGMAGHAGTNAMHLRQDALTGAAEIVLFAESQAGSTNENVVATVGQMRVLPGAVNVVPGKVEFSLDIRSGDEQARNDIAEIILDQSKKIAEKRGLIFEYELIQDLPASPCDPQLTQLLEDVLSAGGIPRKMVSGAGHDAMVMSEICPMSMLFIRCEKGISHHPDERVIVEDVDDAINAMVRLVEKLKDEKIESYIRAS